MYETERVYNFLAESKNQCFFGKKKSSLLTFPLGLDCSLFEKFSKNIVASSAASQNSISFCFWPTVKCTKPEGIKKIKK